MMFKPANEHVLKWEYPKMSQVVRPWLSIETHDDLGIHHDLRTPLIYIYIHTHVYIYMYVWYGMVWYGMVWYGMVWYGMVWYGMYCNVL